MRRLCLLSVGFALVVPGCWSNQPQQQKGTAADPPGDEERAASQDNELTHSVVEETAYYTDGPQQGRPPDGQLQAGTKVKLIRESGSYSLVRTEDGVEAYVAADSLEQLAQ